MFVLLCIMLDSDSDPYGLDFSLSQDNAFSFLDQRIHAKFAESACLPTAFGTRFFCCLENAQLVVVCMHACVHTTLHQFNVKIALNISGLCSLHTGRDALSQS